MTRAGMRSALLLLEQRLDGELDVVADEAAPAHLVEAEIAAFDRGAGMEAEIVARSHRRRRAAVERHVEGRRPGDAVDGEIAGHPAGVAAGALDALRGEG